MKRRRIPQSRRHKKLKTVAELKEVSYVKDVVIQRHRDQQLPRKLREIMESQKQRTTGTTNKKSDKKKIPKTVIRVKPSEKFELCPGMTRTPKPLPEMVEKAPNESDGHFINRLNRMVAQSLAEAKLEDHFDVDLGPKMATIPEHPEDTDETNKKRTEKNRRAALRRKAAKLNRQPRLVRKLNQLDNDGLLHQRDFVPFGEVVHCPPDLEMIKAKKIKTRRNL